MRCTKNTRKVRTVWVLRSMSTSQHPYSRTPTSPWHGTRRRPFREHFGDEVLAEAASADPPMESSKDEGAESRSVEVGV